eukprot:SAG11_NODE_10358_length_837_cov_1.272358_1_plen_177_part_10
MQCTLRHCDSELCQWLASCPRAGTLSHPTSLQSLIWSYCSHRLVQQLDLTNITLVVQDWGGLTGLSVLPSIEGRVAQLVLMNTGIPPAGGSRLTARSKCNFLTWRSVVMACGQYLPVGYIFKMACTTKIYKINAKTVAAYDAPFPSPLFKAGPAKWPLLVPLGRSRSCFAAAPDLLA